MSELNEMEKAKLEVIFHWLSCSSCAQLAGVHVRMGQYGCSEGKDLQRKLWGIFEKMQEAKLVTPPDIISKRIAELYKKQRDLGELLKVYTTEKKSLEDKLARLLEELSLADKEIEELAALIRSSKNAVMASDGDK